MQIEKLNDHLETEDTSIYPKNQIITPKHIDLRQAYKQYMNFNFNNSPVKKEEIIEEQNYTKTTDCSGQQGTPKSMKKIGSIFSEKKKKNIMNQKLDFTIAKTLGGLTKSMNTFVTHFDQGNNDKSFSDEENKEINGFDVAERIYETTKYYGLDIPATREIAKKEKEKEKLEKRHKSAINFSLFPEKDLKEREDFRKNIQNCYNSNVKVEMYKSEIQNFIDSNPKKLIPKRRSYDLANSKLKGYFQSMPKFLNCFEKRGSVRNYLNDNHLFNGQFSNSILSSCSSNKKKNSAVFPAEKFNKIKNDILHENDPISVSHFDCDISSEHNNQNDDSIILEKEYEDEHSETLNKVLDSTEKIDEFNYNDSVGKDNSVNNVISEKSNEDISKNRTISFFSIKEDSEENDLKKNED